ncbi:putative WRKY transcription factor 20 [Raphanus sativus]|nr:putative WRKY transcription factor 20 [Raphanus sativus]
MVYAELDKHRSDPPVQGHGSSHSPSSISETAASSSDLSRPTPPPPFQTSPARTDVPAGSDQDESAQTSRNDYRESKPSADDGYKGIVMMGQITDIIYKGTHDHPKPQPGRRNSGGLAQEERVAVITTYEGKHNHNVPTSESSSNHHHDIQARFRPDETTDTISLNLGVGPSSDGPDHNSNQRHHQNEQLLINQTHPNGVGFRFVHATRLSYYHASLNSGIHQYGSTEMQKETQNGDISSLNHSSYHSIRIILGEYNQVLRRHMKQTVLDSS